MPKSNKANPNRSKTKNERISINELMDDLREAPPLHTMFVGMVKLCEDDANAVMFACAGDCTRWVKIPQSQVDSVEMLHTVICGDHHHQGVRLFLKPPSSDEGHAFAQLAHLHRTGLAALRSSLAQPFAARTVARMPCVPFPPGGCPPGTHHTIDMATGAEICCPD